MITFITSLYKSEEYLPTYISRAKKFSKDLENLNIEHEFIIVPNDPSQAEKDQLDTLNKLNPSVFKIHPRPREPLYASWSYGASVGAGEILCSWNVDDNRFASVIPEIVSTIDPMNAEVIYPSFIYVRGVTIKIPFLNRPIKIPLKVKKITPPEFDKKRFMKEIHLGPFFFFTKKAFEEVGPFDSTFKIAGDFEWQVRAVSRNIIFRRYANAVGVFTNFGTSLSGSKNPVQALENERALNTVNSVRVASQG